MYLLAEVHPVRLTRNAVLRFAQAFHSSYTHTLVTPFGEKVQHKARHTSLRFVRSQQPSVKQQCVTLHY